MPLVTDIKRQVKRTQFYSVSIDGEYSFSLSDLELSLSGLRIGAEVTQTQLDEFCHGAAVGKATSIAYRQLSVRPQTVMEVRRKLADKGVESEVAEITVGRLQEQGILDDLAFARQWLESRALLKPRSGRHLIQELRQHGVPAVVIEEVMGERDGDSEVTAAREVMRKKRLQQKYADPRQVIAALSRLGFSYQVAKAATEESEEAELGTS